MGLTTRKYWRCRDCKWHKSNITKEEILKMNLFVEEPCDTPKMRIIAFADDEKGTCFERHEK